MKAKARGTQSISPVMVGQHWQMNRLAQKWPVTSRYGRETAQLRRFLSLTKPRKKRNDPQPAMPSTESCWQPVTFYSTCRTKRRRNTANAGKDAVSSLRLGLPSFSGLSCFDGNSMWKSPRKAGCASVTAARPPRGYVSGYTDTPTQQKISVANAQWHRLGQFVRSHVRLLARSTKLLITHQAQDAL